MHTIIQMQDGVLNAALSCPGEEVSVEKWKRVVREASGLLTAMGGGEMLIPHRPGDIDVDDD